MRASDRRVWVGRRRPRIAGRLVDGRDVVAVSEGSFACHLSRGRDTPSCSDPPDDVELPASRALDIWQKIEERVLGRPPGRKDARAA